MFPVLMNGVFFFFGHVYEFQMRSQDFQVTTDLISGRSNKI